MYGTQTSNIYYAHNKPFENDVKMYGTQTQCKLAKAHLLFENDVKMYGTQTTTVDGVTTYRLRMM